MFATPIGKTTHEFFCIHCNPLKIFNGTESFIEHLKTTHPEVYFTVKMVLDVTTWSSSSSLDTSASPSAYIKRQSGLLDRSEGNSSSNQTSKSNEYESSMIDEFDELCEAELIEEEEDNSLMVTRFCGNASQEDDTGHSTPVNGQDVDTLPLSTVTRTVAKPSSSTLDMDQDDSDDVPISETVKSALLYPIRIEGKYRCPYKDCTSRGFKMWLDYRDHINNHNGIKPHRCNYCGRTFSYQTTLRRHQRTHLSQQSRPLTPGEQMAITRPWVCTVCDARFVSNDTLRRHEMQKHATSLNCPWCDAHFLNHDQMSEHMKASHHHQKQQPQQQQQQPTLHLSKSESPSPSSSNAPLDIGLDPSMSFPSYTHHHSSSHNN